MSEELNEMVGDLLDQLKDANKKAECVKKETNPLTKDNMEKFVIEKAGRLVEESLDVMTNVKDYISSAPESKDVGSLSELIAATATAIETLNKIIVTDKRNETLIKAKEMDIASRKELKEVDSTTKLLATREQVFKMLIDSANNSAKIIDAEVVKD
jgi:vacuolar-type H+-ATPase subunit E/Vma4